MVQNKREEDKITLSINSLDFQSYKSTQGGLSTLEVLKYLITPHSYLLQNTSGWHVYTPAQSRGFSIDITKETLQQLILEKLVICLLPESLEIVLTISENGQTFYKSRVQADDHLYGDDIITLLSEVNRYLIVDYLNFSEYNNYLLMLDAFGNGHLKPLKIFSEVIADLLLKDLITKTSTHNLQTFIQTGKIAFMLTPTGMAGYRHNKSPIL